MKTIAVFILMILICAFPKISCQGALNAVSLCFSTVIPSLFPFFVISKMFIKSGGVFYLGKIFAPIMKYLFKISPNGSAPFVLGIVSGYPIGAASVCECYKNNEITKNEAQNLLGFCNNSGPSFIIGAVASSLLGNEKIGYALYAVHILSAISVGILLRNNIKDFSVSSIKQKTKKEKNVFTSSVEESVSSILSVCGYVIFFAVIIEFILKLTDNIFVIGFFELTTAVKLLCENSFVLINQKFVIISILCAFASMSINMQTKRFISKTDLSFSKYIFAKCMQAVFAFFYSTLYVFVFPFNAPAFSYFGKTINSNVQSKMTLFCILLFFIYFILLFIKKPRMSD